MPLSCDFCVTGIVRASRGRANVRAGLSHGYFGQRYHRCRAIPSFPTQCALVAPKLFGDMQRENRPGGGINSSPIIGLPFGKGSVLW